MLKITERDNYVIVCTEDASNLEELVGLAKKYPGKQILISVGYEITEEEIKAMQQDPLDFGRMSDNLLLSYPALGGDYRGDSLIRHHRIPPTPSNNPQIGRYGPSKRPGR